MSTLSPRASGRLRPGRRRDLPTVWWALSLAAINLGYFLLQVVLSTNTFFNVGSPAAYSQELVWSACGLMLAQAAAVFLRARPVLMFVLIVALQFALLALVGDRDLVVGVLLVFAVYNLTARTRWPVWLSSLAIAVVADYGWQMFVDRLVHVPGTTYVLAAFAVQIPLNYTVGAAPGLLVGAYQRHAAVAADRARIAREREVAVRDREEAVRAAAVAGERMRMARELHDITAYRLSGILLESESALDALDSAPEAVRAALMSVREESTQTWASLNEMVRVLRPDGVADPADLAPEEAGEAGLRALVASARKANPATSLTITGDLSTLSPLSSLACYRIVQESLSNARKHAPGAPVDVEVELADGQLSIAVRNARPAQSAASMTVGGGFGLVSMQERASVLGGALESHPSDGGGWLTRVVIPLGVVVAA